MKGILLISHGEMAKGMADSAKMFFGEEIAQMDYLCLRLSDNSDEFGKQIAEKIQALNSGDGVMVLADLYGGTPCNQAITLLEEKVDLIPGMNFGMLMQLLSDREYGEVEVSALMEAGRNAIVDIKAMLSAVPAEDDWL